MEFPTGFIPEQITTLLKNPAIQNLTSTSTTLLTNLSTFHSTYLTPYIIDPLTSLATSYSTASMPDLVSLLLLAILLLVSLKILDYAHRVIVFWVSLVLRLAFWGAVLSVAWYVYRTGWDKALRDFGWLWGVVEGLAEGVIEGDGVEKVTRR